MHAIHGCRTPGLDGRQTRGLDPQPAQAAAHGHAAGPSWVTHITYIRAWQGWPYRAVVLDLFSREVVGWATEPTIHRELLLYAVVAAVRQRGPRGTLLHADQTIQYGSDTSRRFCRADQPEPSMSREDNCWDNAAAESFFSSFKKERIQRRIYPSREVAIADISAYIEDSCNRGRRHRHPGGVSPEQFGAARRLTARRVH